MLLPSILAIEETMRERKDKEAEIPAKFYSTDAMMDRQCTGLTSH